MISPSTWLLTEELKRRGFQTTEFDDEYLVLAQKNGKKTYIHAAKTLTSTAAGFFLCKEKDLTKKVLNHFGIPTAKWAVINRSNPTHDLKYPVVVKPLALSGGQDVVVGLKDDTEVSHYLNEHPQYQEVLVEELLHGPDTRILIIDGKFFAACQKIPPELSGDGYSTIEQLVEKEQIRRNALFDQQKANQTYITNLEPILFDEEAIKYIREQGKERTSVLSLNEKLTIRKNGNVSTGGIAIDVTDTVSPQIREVCEKIADVFALPTLGIDIMTEDLTKPLNILNGWGVVEVNGSPGLQDHVFVNVGQSRNPIPILVDAIENELFS